MHETFSQLFETPPPFNPPRYYQAAQLESEWVCSQINASWSGAEAVCQDGSVKQTLAVRGVDVNTMNPSSLQCSRGLAGGAPPCSELRVQTGSSTGLA